MTETKLARKHTPAASFDELVRKVKATLLEGQREIEKAKVQTYWQTGRYIHEHILQRQDRAEYGDEVILKLSKILNVGDELLYRTLRFYQAFPTISSVRRKLTWAHYRTLMTVEDEGKRKSLEAMAEKENWASRELEIEVRNLNYEKRKAGWKNPEAMLLKVKAPGKLFTFRVIRPESIHSRSQAPLIDLGFSVTLSLDRFPGANFRPETIITSAKDSKGRYSLVKAEDAGEESLFTYKGFVEHVIDGDTLKVEIDLGFHCRARQVIRIKYIDCPEMNTEGGRAAKKYLENLLQGVEFLKIRTRGRDKFGRYLGDVFVPQKDGSLSYLNNLLLEKGHAVRVRD